MSDQVMKPTRLIGESNPACRLIEVFAGVAPFADYTTDEAEWQMYQRMWMCDKELLS